MFIRAKKKGPHTYLHIVESERVGNKVVQHMRHSLGRLDQLQESGALDSFLASGLKFARKLNVLDAHAHGETTTTKTERIGAPLLVERLWRDCGIAPIIDRALAGRRFAFPVERAIFVTVLHRLFAPGSDRSAEYWMQRYRIDGNPDLELQHFYRAMAWLGEVIEPGGEKTSKGAPPPTRRMKDEIEEALFDTRRELFNEMALVFFDTTTLYFDGAGGQEIGRRGHSKDHRPEAPQMVVGMILDNQGNPICSEMWPGNTADVASLIPVATRLKERFGIGRICIVADRGMISEETIAALEAMEWEYILGVRMRRCKDVSIEILGRAGRFEQVHEERTHAKDPSPLRVKEVRHAGQRYIVCVNDEQVRKDRYDREAIIASLRENLGRGAKSFIGNKGYRRYLKSTGTRFEIDEDKIREEERYDGKWVLRTNTTLSTAEVALKYKQLWMVEDIFRTMKSVLETRPIYHHNDDSIIGHVFCSFLAVVLRKELQDRIARKGWKLEWKQIIADVDAIEEITVRHQNLVFRLRTEATGSAGKVFQAVGIALPPVLRDGPPDG
ncbi:MAG: IS1634 family transposase [Bacteroidetes bacterium]|nr:IS1634 family transposase [Bacteroidota bacterium]